MKIKFYLSLSSWFQLTGINPGAEKYLWQAGITVKGGNYWAKKYRRNSVSPFPFVASRLSYVRTPLVYCFCVSCKWIEWEMCINGPFCSLLPVCIAMIYFLLNKSFIISDSTQSSQNIYIWLSNIPLKEGSKVHSHLNLLFP